MANFLKSTKFAWILKITYVDRIYTIRNCYTVALFKDRLRNVLFRIYRVSPCCSSYAVWRLSLVSPHGWVSSCFCVLNFHICMLQLIWAWTWERYRVLFAQFPFRSQPSVLLKGTCTLLTYSQHYLGTKLSPIRGQFEILVLVWKNEWLDNSEVFLLAQFFATTFTEDLV